MWLSVQSFPPMKSSFKNHDIGRCSRTFRTNIWGGQVLPAASPTTGVKRGTRFTISSSCNTWNWRSDATPTTVTFLSSFSVADGDTPRRSYSFVSTTLAMVLLWTLFQQGGERTKRASRWCWKRLCVSPADFRCNAEFPVPWDTNGPEFVCQDVEFKTGIVS